MCWLSFRGRWLPSERIGLFLEFVYKRCFAAAIGAASAAVGPAIAVMRRPTPAAINDLGLERFAADHAAGRNGFAGLGFDGITLQKLDAVALRHDDRVIELAALADEFN